MLNFKLYFEQKLRDSEEKKNSNKEAEGYFDATQRELGVGPQYIPDLLEVSYIQLEDLCFNQVIFKVIKPINLNDAYVNLKFHDVKNPNFQQSVVYCKNKEKYSGSLEGLKDRTFSIPMKKFEELFSRPFQFSLQQSQGMMF